MFGMLTVCLHSRLVITHTQLSSKVAVLDLWLFVNQYVGIAYLSASKYTHAPLTNTQNTSQFPDTHVAIKNTECHPMTHYHIFKCQYWHIHKVHGYHTPKVHHHHTPKISLSPSPKSTAITYLPPKPLPQLIHIRTDFSWGLS